jgi:CheY-like chemotaxis protein
MRWHLSRAVPLRNEQGRVLRWFGTNTDITDLRQMEEALKEADRRKDEFLAMLAHELRNPLAPIRNAVQVLRLLGGPEPNMQRSREMIERQVKHLTRLVDDLLDVSRITTGKIKLQRERVDLAAVVNRAVESCRPLIDANHHHLSVSLPDEPVPLLADPTRLEQVFANLLNNAAKYTERGGALALAAERQGDEVLVRVRDNGFGIPARVLPHVFDLFAQADRTLDRSQGGLGIGLTLVRTLAEMHGGGVTAHSEGPGKGSEFVVRLPVAPDSDGCLPAGETGSAAPAPEVPPGLRILVVDDNRDAADSLALLLRLWGHEVRTSYDGPTGLKEAGSYFPQLVFLDIGLPGLDGYEVARRLRGELGGELRLVAMTGYGQEEDRRRSREAGFDLHLVKPVDTNCLQEVVTQATAAAGDQR